MEMTKEVKSMPIGAGGLIFNPVWREELHRINHPIFREDM